MNENFESDATLVLGQNPSEIDSCNRPCRPPALRWIREDTGETKHELYATPNTRQEVSIREKQKKRQEEKHARQFPLFLPIPWHVLLAMRRQLRATVMNPVVRFVGRTL